MVAFVAFFLFKATEACTHGSLRAPLYVAATYAIAFLATRRWSWGSRAVLALGACHTCFSVSLTVKANFASSIVPLLSPAILAATALGCLVVAWRPKLEATAVLDWCAVFAGLRTTLLVFFKLERLGDVEVLLCEAWNRGFSFTAERLRGERFLSLSFEGFSFGRVYRAAKEGASWFEGVLKKAGFKPVKVEGWIEVERLLYAPSSADWEAAAFTPCEDGWRTERPARPSGRRALASAFRRRFTPITLNHHPQALLKAITFEEVLSAGRL